MGNMRRETYAKPHKKHAYSKSRSSPLDTAFYYEHADIARLLINAKADIFYVNRRLWMAPRYIFDADIPNPNRSELYDICNELNFTEWNHQDILGWTCLHRAAAYRSAEDILRLSRAGASPTIQTSMKQWLPIQCAVRFDNQSTFQALANFLLPLDLISLVDSRGWTLLHLAAQNGSAELIQNLLGRGLDPKAESYGSTVWVPNGIERRAATPLDIARACGRENVYLAALEGSGTPLD
jgi:ankyrin repeat protein